jgi:class 3 adenylate cyclase/predicted ATPase
LDIAAWLHGLGLGRYEPAFRANNIDADVLSELTEADLERLGVASLGHRKRLLRVIAALADRTAPKAGPPPERTAAPTLTAAHPGAERRQLTVMFVDLVGSTALSTKLDPEELADVLCSYQNIVAGGVVRFGGYVAKFMGDGLLAYFGWPRAHEDAAERAIRAGLTIAEAVGDLKAPDAESLAARIGIATGLVVVGELIGEGVAQQEAVVGETPNLAARLQQLAAPGTVVIAEATRRLVGTLFEFIELDPVEVKGFAAPVYGFRVAGADLAQGRFDALNAAVAAPLVGRDQELALFLDRWRLARAGEGQVVLLSGEPGMGKSRVVLALRERLRSEEWVSLRYHGSPYHVNSVLHPVIEQLQRVAGFARGDDNMTKLAKLEALLVGAAADMVEVAPFFADLLSLPVEGRFALPPLTPQEKKAGTFRALLAQLEGLATQSPVLIVLEDAHWLDPTTLELFGHVVERIQRLPVLLVMTFRPEFKPPWKAHAHTTALALTRLNRAAAEVIIGHLTAGRRLPEPLLTEIVVKTDGVPFFVEELTKTVLESSVLRETPDGYALDGQLSHLAIPTTLQDSLMSRLDRLGEAKRVAQIGAVIGRKFSYELLKRVSPMSGEDLRIALRQLTRSRLIFTRGTPPSAEYTFKHMLVQETAYRSLLRGHRKVLHRQIVLALQDTFPDISTTQPELLAYHYAMAGDAGHAVKYWTQAGQHAVERSAELEALGHFESALQILQTLPLTKERDKLELSIQIGILTPIIALKGYASSETAQHATKARSIAERIGEVGQLFPIMYGEWTYNMVRGKISAALNLAVEYLHASKCYGDTTTLVVGYRIKGFSYWGLGELRLAREALDEAIRLYDPNIHASSAYLYGHDSRVSSLCFLALTLLFLGYPRQAYKASREALGQARQIGHANTQAIALCIAGALFNQLLGYVPATRRFSARTISLSRKRALAMWLETGRILDAWAMAQRGRPDQAITPITAALDRFGSIGTKLMAPHFLGLRAEVLAASGQPEAGLQAVDDALALIRETDERVWEADLYRLQGELQLARRGQQAEVAAEAAFRRAIVVARSQHARFWELRATISLARMWIDQGKRENARAVLAEVCQTFGDGCDIPGLAQAKALLRNAMED